MACIGQKIVRSIATRTYRKTAEGAVKWLKWFGVENISKSGGKNLGVDTWEELAQWKDDAAPELWAHLAGALKYIIEARTQRRWQDMPHSL